MRRLLPNILPVTVLFLLTSMVTFQGAEASNTGPDINFFSESSIGEMDSLDTDPLIICKTECFKKSELFAEKKQPDAGNSRHSESRKNGPKLQLNTDYFLGFLTDGLHVISSPLRWNKTDWFKVGLVLGTTGAFFALDNDIQEFVQDNRTGATNDLSDIFERFGNGATVVPALAAYYLFGHFLKYDRAERVALLSLESFAITGALAAALKFGVGRERPNTGENSTTFEGPGQGGTSFPSGHSITAFAVATVFATEYDDYPLVAPIAYGIATLTALERLNDNKHWASDVFFGGALGYFISKTIIKLNSNKKGRHYTIYPRISKTETGLVFAMQY
ncbi:MAG: phosphatase PAP2 family protein [Nitrospinaceae bacterium]